MQSKARCRANKRKSSPGDYQPGDIQPTNILASQSCGCLSVGFSFDSSGFGRSMVQPMATIARNKTNMVTSPEPNISDRPRRRDSTRPTMMAAARSSLRVFTAKSPSCDCGRGRILRPFSLCRRAASFCRTQIHKGRGEQPRLCVRGARRPVIFPAPRRGKSANCLTACKRLTL